MAEFQALPSMAQVAVIGALQRVIDASRDPSGRFREPVWDDGVAIE